MIRKVLLLFIFASHAISDHCVRYTFEQNFNKWLTHEWNYRVCGPLEFWLEGKYSNIDLSDKNDQSTTFIMPATYSDQSCVSSFIFTMHNGGTIEVNIYMEAEPSNQIIVYALGLEDTIQEAYLGGAANAANNLDFVSGWHTLKIILTREGTYPGYISIVGVTSPNSIVLVDSFRYIPPGVDERYCRLYDDGPATPEPTTSLKPTKPDPSTPESTTIPEIPTPESTTPEATPETPTPATTPPTTPEITTPDTTTPEPTTPDTTTTEPTTPKQLILKMKLKMMLKLP